MAKRKLVKFRYVGSSVSFKDSECDNSGQVHVEGSGLCAFETLCGSCDTGQTREETYDPVDCAGCLDIWNMVKNGTI